MSNKKSFILHTDSLSVLDELTDEQAGQLFKAIKDYQEGNEKPLDPFIRIAFVPFRANFIRNDEKWEHTKTARSEAGKLGGRPSKAKKANALQKSNSLIKKQNNPVSVNDSVSVSVSVNDINTISAEIVGEYDFDSFWELYGKKVGAKSKCSKKWEKLSLAVKKQIMETLPKFLAGIKDKQFQPFPETYLNQERWKDEEISTPQSETKWECRAMNAFGYYYPTLTQAEIDFKISIGHKVEKIRVCKN